MEQAVLLEQLGHGGAVAAHTAGDGDLVALGRLVELDGHILHLEGLMVHLEAGAHELGKVGVHIHRGEQELLGVGVGVVVVETALRLLNAVHAAPDRRFAEGQVVDVLNAVEGHGVEEDKAFELILVFLPLLGIVKQLCHGAHTRAHHGDRAHQHQHCHQQAKGLTGTAAVEPGVFFRGHIGFHLDFRLLNWTVVGHTGS